jgi:magnesium transporter
MGRRQRSVMASGSPTPRSTRWWTGILPALVGVATVAEELEERLDPRNERASTAALENLTLLRRDLSAFRRLAIAQHESLRRLGRWSRGLCDHLSDLAD